MFLIQKEGDKSDSRGLQLLHNTQQTELDS